MTNKSKNIGTKFESDTVNYLRANGFPNARREVLHGSLDQGDVWVCEGLIVECKGGLAAETASDEQLRKWCVETEMEKRNAKADSAFLCVKRRGFGVGKMAGMRVVQNDGGMLTTFLLGEYISFLKELGFGPDGFVSPKAG